MLIEAKTPDFAALLRGEAPVPYDLADSPVAPPEVLAMLAQLADHIRAVFSPSAWLIVEGREIVGLISPTQPLDAADQDAKALPDWSPEAALAKAEAEAQTPEARAAALKKRAVRIRKADVEPKDPEA